MIVFLHGVPETAQLWDRVRSQLHHDSVALSLPGFGCARPEGFSATKDAYVDWLVGELDRFDEPVDLVGHDWGALLTIRVATAFGTRLHSWAADVASGHHADSKWHDVARVWQTPGDGEAFVESVNASTPDQLAPIYEGYGLSGSDALTVATMMIDPVMGQCILDLYRSSTPNLYASWGNELTPTSAPGLVLIPEEDPFTNADMSHVIAEKLDARTENLPGVGHWRALQDPVMAARVIDDFVSSLE